MNIRHLIGGSAAALLSTAAVTGIVALVAYDLMGTKTSSRLWTWMTEEREPQSIEAALPENTAELTFFRNKPIEGSSEIVVTGLEYASVDDVLKKRPTSQWCYVNLGMANGLPRHVTLANKKPGSAIEYVDPDRYPANELAALGFDAKRLSALARSHCDFAQ